MKFHVTDEDGAVLDAAVLLEYGAIVVLSRGGSAASRSSQNKDYARALRLILSRLLDKGPMIVGAWVDSVPARKLPLADRQVYFDEDRREDAKSLFSLFGKRMEGIARAPGSIPNKGNRNKRLRIETATRSVGELAAIVGAKPDADVPRSALRLPADDLRKVTEIEIFSAIVRLQSGFAEHGFDDPLEYLLVAEDGTLLPPKAVFGLAASEALGFPVGPSNFNGGLGTVCFQVLEAAGWSIISKDAAIEGAVAADVDAEWSEGNINRVEHMRRERHSGVARAKKAEMRRRHGRLFCEECGLDPVAEFGVDGAACIEVHHRATEVSAMPPGHRTRLCDVECLCANCHRIRHQRMKRKTIS
ncbi:MAG: hypothetical protein AAGF59_13710 [Pseudomonadota bacterium]